MANKINIDLDKCVGCGACESACPFGAISVKDGKAVVDGEKCRFCGSCVEACPVKAITMQKDEVKDAVDKSLYKGVWVYAEQRHGEISSVVYELLNKGSELAKTLNVPLSAILIGSNISAKAQDLINRGADKVYVYDDPILAEFQDDPYSCILADLIKEEKPEIVLMGATNIGRSFASRVAAKIYTGLTADCTALEIDPETRNLMQTRPAFGGNIMATILTPRHRPQMATVRHKVFKEAKVQEGRTGEVINKTVDAQKVINRTKFIGFFKDQSADVNICIRNIYICTLIFKDQSADVNISDADIYICTLIFKETDEFCSVNNFLCIYCFIYNFTCSAFLNFSFFKYFMSNCCHLRSVSRC